MQLLEITEDDLPFVWRMLTYAASMQPGGEASVAEAKANADLQFYVEGWGRPGDLGLVAWRGGERLGAAWLRLSPGGAQPFKVASETEPELAIGVEPAHRGGGVGQALLGELLRRAQGRYPAVVLSVREANPSARLYQRVGFTTTRQGANRVGGNSLVMRCSLEGPR